MFKLLINRKNEIKWIVSRDHVAPGDKMKWGSGAKWTVLRCMVNMDCEELKGLELTNIEYKIGIWNK